MSTVQQHFLLTGRSSFWACCAAPPPPKPKKEKKVKKEKEKKERKEKEKKEKKSKKEKTNKETSDDQHSLPVGFQCNGSDEVNPVVMRDQRDDIDQYPPEGKPQRH